MTIELQPDGLTKVHLTFIGTSYCHKISTYCLSIGVDFVDNDPLYIYLGCRFVPQHDSRKYLRWFKEYNTMP